MNILWLGSYASDEMLSRMPVRSIGQASAVTSQKSIIYGIDQCPDAVRMCTISAQRFPTYPTYPQKQIERIEWSRNGKDKDISIAFSNRKATRLLSQWRHYRKEALAWLKQVPDGEDIHIIVYEPVIERLMTARRLKKLCKRAKVHLIVPDIPEYVGNLRSAIKRVLKQIRKRILLYLMRCVDKYIFYAEPMADYYGINESRYMVMEGSFDPREISCFDTEEQPSESGDVTLLYSGAITKGRAVDKFVEAFCAIDDLSLKLWFTGGGDYDSRLKELEAQDARIHHYGYLKTREEVLALQSKADILLHIRDREALSSKYCFPSKLFEYMASGSLVLTVKIPGIPEEYYQYMLTLEEITEEAICAAIENIKHMPLEERRALGEAAREYVLTHKSSKAQAERILEFIQE